MRRGLQGMATPIHRYPHHPERSAVIVGATALFVFGTIVFATVLAWPWIAPTQFGAVWFLGELFADPESAPWAVISLFLFGGGVWAVVGGAYYRHVTGRTFAVTHPLCGWVLALGGLSAAALVNAVSVLLRSRAGLFPGLVVVALTCILGVAIVATARREGSRTD